MRKNLYKNIYYLKILITSNFFICSLFYECDRNHPILKNNQCVSIYCTDQQFKSGECVIDEPITKIQWINNIIKYEKTNGDIFLFSDTVKNEILIFSTTSSNNHERIFFGITEDEYIFKNNDENVPNIKKNINQSEVINPHFCLIKYETNGGNINYIITIGTQNSNIVVFDTENYQNDLTVYNSSNFLNDTNRIINGSKFLCYFINYYAFLLIGTVTKKNNDPSNNYLTLFNYKIIRDHENNKININFLYSNDLGFTKGDYISCFIFNTNEGHISCFYQSKENLYTIKVFKNTFDDAYNGKFEEKNETIIGSPSNINDENLYFLKGIYIDEYQAIYSYFSGENDNIPTFLFYKINSDFSLDYLYTDLHDVKLYDYIFNNNIDYNDLVRVSKDYYLNLEEFYFISTNNDKDTLIIANFLIKTKSSVEHKLLIRYYTIKLQEYYNMKILNGFKAINYNVDD